MIEEILNGLGAGWLLGGLGATILAGLLIFTLLMYVYVAYTLMVIAQKTNTENAWLAWIPIANLYLMTQIAQVQWWTFLVVLLAGWIPFIGQLLAIGIPAWWWWEISERRNSPGWLGLLTLVPIANLVIIGYLAFKD